jgi:hypothetical protein
MSIPDGYLAQSFGLAENETNLGILQNVSIGIWPG